MIEGQHIALVTLNEVKGLSERFFVARRVTTPNICNSLDRSLPDQQRRPIGSPIESLGNRVMYRVHQGGKRRHINRE